MYVYYPLHCTAQSTERNAASQGSVTSGSTGKPIVDSYLYLFSSDMVKVAENDDGGATAEDPRRSKLDIDCQPGQVRTGPRRA